MTQTRRRFMATLGAATALTGIARPVVAQMALGSGTLTTVSDGTLVLPGSFLFAPMPQDELAPILADYDLSADQLTPECNVTLWRDGDRVVLFDVGSGFDFMPTAGKLLDNLSAAGVTPDQITDVVFTHAHPDHIWGLLDDFDEVPFPDANFHMGRTEWDYWWNPATVDTIGADRAAFAVGAKRRMEAIEDSVAFFDDSQEILPGLSAVASFGHTPGHMSFEVRSGSNAALVVGDAISNHHVAFRKPEWPSGADQDMDLAAQTRLRLLDRLASEQMATIGFHLPGGGMGRVEAADGAYRFVPEAS